MLFLIVKMILLEWVFVSLCLFYECYIFWYLNIIIVVGFGFSEIYYIIICNKVCEFLII